MTYLCINVFNASSWAPFNLVSSLFLISSGVVAIVLDIPAQIQQGSASPALMGLRNSVYTYLLFLTRFCGRGGWYFFLSTQVWLVLYDSKINRILAVCMTLYIALVGVAACVKGFLLSQKLHAVRMAIKQSGQPMAHMAGSSPA